jgi:uracil-DNA glycosylase
VSTLLEEIKQCEICAAHLPLEPNPILRFTEKSKIMIIGQAPGTIAHQRGLDFDDASGNKLRSWLGVDRETFYNTDNFAVIPMGFCYPGKGKTGDLPPRPECRPKWHPSILEVMKEVQLTILIGAYAQKAYLGDKIEKNLTETVRNYHKYLPLQFPIPHPSPTNRFWMAKNKWFVTDVLPELDQRVRRILS